LNANNTRWEYPPFIALGSKEVTKRARSEFRNISVTKETRGTHWEADLKARRKLQVEFSLIREWEWH
jgi:hypothetical protein